MVNSKNMLYVCALLISACSAQIEDYQSVQTFDIQQYFTGSIVARGIVENYQSKVTRRFCVDIEGTWQGNKGLLAETFYFDDGEVSYRNWQLIKQQDGSYLGTADDVIGTAIGRHQGFAFQLNYTLQLTLDDSTVEVSMDDWMYKLDELRVMNKTAISKLGIDVANVTLFFDKSTSSTCN